MAYIPPNGVSVDHNFLDGYIAPNGNTVNYNFTNLLTVEFEGISTQLFINSVILSVLVDNRFHISAFTHLTIAGTQQVISGLGVLAGGSTELLLLSNTSYDNILGFNTSGDASIHVNSVITYHVNTSIPLAIPNNIVASNISSTAANILDSSEQAIILSEQSFKCGYNSVSTKEASNCSGTNKFTFSSSPNYCGFNTSVKIDNDACIVGHKITTLTPQAKLCGSKRIITSIYACVTANTSNLLVVPSLMCGFESVAKNKLSNICGNITPLLDIFSINQSGRYISIYSTMACVPMTPYIFVLEPPPPPIEYDTKYIPIEHIMKNSVIIFRVSDGKPINAISLSIINNANSWASTFTLNLATKESFEALIPKNGEFQEVGAIINGHEFHFIVESWNTSRSYASASWSVSGRSLIAYFSSPHSEVSSGVINTTGSLHQLALQQLDSTGWTLEWNVADYVVPADTYTYNNKNRVNILSDFANAVGASLSSHPKDKIIYVDYKYLISPWEWHLWSGHYVLGRGAYFSEPISYIHNIRYDRVRVLGMINGGVGVDARIDGEDGLIQLGQYSDRLILDHEGARQKARNLLSAASGPREIHRVETQLASTYIKPKRLIELQDDELLSWIGMVKSNKISVDSTSITQTIEVEKYIH